MEKKKVKILVVDDEKDICSFIKLLFEKKGFAVSTALSVTTAMKVAKKIKPDIALLDIYLKKGENGIDALKQIIGIVPECKCVMVTWDKSPELIKEAKKLGAVSYVTKPLTVSQLIKAVTVYAGKSGKRGKHG